MALPGRQGYKMGYMNKNPSRGEDHGNAKLSDRKVADIRDGHREGMSIHLLAKLFKVTRRTIRLVVTRQTWRHLP